MLLAGRNNQRSQVCAGGGVAPDSIKSCHTKPNKVAKSIKGWHSSVLFWNQLFKGWSRKLSEMKENWRRFSNNVRFLLISGKKEKKPLLFIFVRFHKREGRKV